MRVVDSYQVHIVVHKGDHYVYGKGSWWNMYDDTMILVKDVSLKDHLDKAWKSDWEKDIMERLRKGEQMIDVLKRWEDV